MIYSGCHGKKDYNSKNSSGEYTVLWKGCGNWNEAICLLDENYTLLKIEVLHPEDERMRFKR